MKNSSDHAANDNRSANMRSGAFDVMYVEGPGDIVESFLRWHSQQDVVTETAITFSGQFFDYCEQNSLRAYAVSYSNDTRKESTEQFRVENRPKRIFGAGALYHFSQIVYGLSILATAIRVRPKALHVTSGVTYWFVLAPLKLLNIRIVPHFHNALWPKGNRPRDPIKRVLLALDGWFIKNIAFASVCVSPEVERQIKQLAKTDKISVNQFCAQFHRQDFENRQVLLRHDQKPFVVVFAGRVERNKGVFDILDMADRLRDKNVVFEICGGGSALEELRNECTQRNLELFVHIRGQLERPELLKAYQRSHVVIIPTRSDLIEGFAMVAAEAILLGRPIITSDVVPALEVLGGAALAAKADDIADYVAAIHKLLHDKVLYEQLCENCIPLREQFLNGKNGLTMTLNNLNGRMP
ncbi:glycosyltransferase family 4 protein [Methylococcus sp. EFPC2]|uniref:glycosyltransferase family 4 protein n=1 Tax=Methylococcus sp. EFPC2 TaxID=2812648 RepID=UPI001F0815C1|nr:glycosyltransferase [Methylococcus sp. EFPC2]